MKNKKINFDELFGPPVVPPAVPGETIKKPVAPAPDAPPFLIDLEKADNGNNKNGRNWGWWIAGGIGVIVIGGIIYFAFLHKPKQKKKDTV